MSQAIGTFLSLFLLGCGLVALAWVLTVGLTPEAKRGRIQRWLLDWLIRGVVVPGIIWALLNVGLAWYLQPFMPQVQAARNRGGPWAGEYLEVTALGLFLVSSYWSAVTLAWVLASALSSAEPASREDFKRLSLTCLLGLGIPAGLIVVCGGLPATGFAGMLILAPLAGYSRGFLQPRKLPPMYSRAVARMKFGKYNEAESEILKELEIWENDYDGWMMLAELYANQFNSLGEAEQTVLELCGQPQTTSSQMAVALHRLADWHLKLAKNPDGARRALLMICDRLPGTHLAHMAQLRIDQLPASAFELSEPQSSRPVPLPALGDQLDEPAHPSAGDLAEASRLANAYVEQLRQNPNNAAAREKFARLLTESLGKAQLGLEQIELLLKMPDRSDAERAEWLGLLAAWRIKYQHDLESGRKALERLTREYPGSIQAFAARRRLQLLARQLKSESS